MPQDMEIEGPDDAVPKRARPSGSGVKDRRPRKRERVSSGQSSEVTPKALSGLPVDVWTLIMTQLMKRGYSWRPLARTCKRLLSVARQHRARTIVPFVNGVWPTASLLYPDLAICVEMAGVDSGQLCAPPMPCPNARHLRISNTVLLVTEKRWVFTDPKTMAFGGKIRRLDIIARKQNVWPDIQPTTWRYIICAFPNVRRLTLRGVNLKPMETKKAPWGWGHIERLSVKGCHGVANVRSLLSTSETVTQLTCMNNGGFLGVNEFPNVKIFRTRNLRNAACGPNLTRVIVNRSDDYRPLGIFIARARPGWPSSLPVLLQTLEVTFADRHPWSSVPVAKRSIRGWVKRHAEAVYKRAFDITVTCEPSTEPGGPIYFRRALLTFRQDGSQATTITVNVNRPPPTAK